MYDNHRQRARTVSSLGTRRSTTLVMKNRADFGFRMRMLGAAATRDELMPCSGSRVESLQPLRLVPL